jgi:hypothetical protein
LFKSQLEQCICLTTRRFALARRRSVAASNHSHKRKICIPSSASHRQLDACRIGIAETILNSKISRLNRSSCRGYAIAAGFQQTWASQFVGNRLRAHTQIFRNAGKPLILNGNVLTGWNRKEAGFNP